MGDLAVLYAVTAAVAAGWIGGRAAWIVAWWPRPACGCCRIRTTCAGRSPERCRFSPVPLPRWPETFAGWADGQSLTIAMVMAIVSVVIGCGAQTRRPSLFIAIGVGAALVLWFAGQAFGGLMTGQATDPNIGPLFMLLAYAALPAANRSRLMLRTVQTGAWRELGPAG